MDNLLIFGMVKFLHNLFTAVWIGGLITLGVVILPSLRKRLGMTPETKQLIEVIQKKLSVLIYVSIIGLFVTGLLLGNRSPLYQGPFNLDNTYSVILTMKHLLYLLMVVIAVVRSQLLNRWKALSNTKREKINVAFLVMNIALGVLVLLLSSFTAVLGTQT